MMIMIQLCIWMTAAHRLELFSKAQINLAADTKNSSE